MGATRDIVVFCDDAASFHARHPRRNIVTFARGSSKSWDQGEDVWQECHPDSARMLRIEPGEGPVHPRRTTTRYVGFSRGHHRLPSERKLVTRMMLGDNEIPFDDLESMVLPDIGEEMAAGVWRAYELNCKCKVPIRRFCEHEFWPVLDQLAAAGITEISRHALRGVLGDKAPHSH